MARGRERGGTKRKVKRMWRGETQSGVIDRLSAHLCQTSHPDEIENKGFSSRLSPRIPSIFSFPLQRPPSFFSYIFFFFPPLFPPSPPLSKVRGINLLQLIALEHFIEQMHSSLLLHFPPLTLLFFLTPFFSPSSLLFFFFSFCINSNSLPQPEKKKQSQSTILL